VPAPATWCRCAAVLAGRNTGRACPPVRHKPQTRKRKRAEKLKLMGTFRRAGMTSAPIFSPKSQRSDLGLRSSRLGDTDDMQFSSFSFTACSTYMSDSVALWQWQDGRGNCPIRLNFSLLINLLPKIENLGLKSQFAEKFWGKIDILSIMPISAGNLQFSV